MGKVRASLPSPYTKLSTREEEEAKINGVPKGFVPVLVGEEEAIFERVFLPTKLIKHPYIVSLLEISAGEFGYEHQGMLRIFFDAGSFRLMVRKLSKKK